ncbi:hypothetical protein POSPLADRAFT_1041162 [Postia placenta MAD-698-R-SB12]|uniref:Uncharacterized protein n=1 Tax=Postia placenta MAD-698-R-SB12 TaxID=670580 RepID=A0A1X6MRC1_9APHY|nr:hypothetical protein POSPLADRAFT_1041162 [Postia placenta MAD-698-R-SB12]OSX58840.1 hypothetical protein POSPLADRAFT_1041162 [Postia placenta MAD-698-R-SB12]
MSKFPRSAPSLPCIDNAHYSFAVCPSDATEQSAKDETSAQRLQLITGLDVSASDSLSPHF